MAEMHKAAAEFPEDADEQQSRESYKPPSSDSPSLACSLFLRLFAVTFLIVPVFSSFPLALFLFLFLLFHVYPLNISVSCF